MTLTNLFTSPLEQFQVLPAFSIFIDSIDFSITNETIILGLIAFFSIVFFLSLTKASDSSYFMIPTRWQVIILPLTIFIFFILFWITITDCSGQPAEPSLGEKLYVWVEEYKFIDDKINTYKGHHAVMTEDLADLHADPSSCEVEIENTELAIEDCGIRIEVLKLDLAEHRTQCPIS